jgi:hypothetical protein
VTARAWPTRVDGHHLQTLKASELLERKQQEQVQGCSLSPENSIPSTPQAAAEYSSYSISFRWDDCHSNCRGEHSGLWRSLAAHGHQSRSCSACLISSLRLFGCHLHAPYALLSGYSSQPHLWSYGLIYSWVYWHPSLPFYQSVGFLFAERHVLHLGAILQQWSCQWLPSTPRLPGPGVRHSSGSLWVETGRNCGWNYGTHCHEYSPVKLLYSYLKSLCLLYWLLPMRWLPSDDGRPSWQSFLVP